MRATAALPLLLLLLPPLLLLLLLHLADSAPSCSCPPPSPPCSYKRDGEVVAHMRKLEKQREMMKQMVLAH